MVKNRYCVHYTLTMEFSYLQQTAKFRKKFSFNKYLVYLERNYLLRIIENVGLILKRKCPSLHTPFHMNIKVGCNSDRLKPIVFVVPISLTIAIVGYLYSQNALSVSRYIEIQKHGFFFLNAALSQFPNTEYNLTQLGDALIFLSLLSIFIPYSPKLWEYLISASLISAIASWLLKQLFAVPRPAAVFDHSSFVIVGKTLSGNNSLPSGHAITIFTTLTILLFAFLPRRISLRIPWIILLILIGLSLSFSRVAIGAHYPLDVIIGGIAGYLCAIAGIYIVQRFKIWCWIANKKYYPVLIAALLVCCICIINKIINENLIIFYFALIGLLASGFKLVRSYVQR